MSDDYIYYYGPETAALEISSDGKVQWVIPRAITVEKGSATPMGDGFDEYRQYDQDLRDAYTAGLDAAREAVAALIPRDYELNWCAALDAIDALRESP